MGEYVMLANGTRLEGSAAVYADTCWIWLNDRESKNNSIPALIGALMAKGACDRIEYHYGASECVTIEGYTDLDVVRRELDGNCSARLVRTWS